MNIQELRVGNKVFLPNLDAVAIVSEIRFKYLRCAFQRKDIDEPHVSLIDIVECEPIKLNEEWLFKAGFEKTMAWTYAKDLIGNNKLVYYLGEKGVSIGFKNYSDFRCEYVHQLQNLYFAITGKELTLNN